ncbi:Uncharacterised protein [Chlamydia trachomatis]|nr:Uncharacterised protein [Chlamydia trachomatis]
MSTILNLMIGSNRIFLVYDIQLLVVVKSKKEQIVSFLQPPPKKIANQKKEKNNFQSVNFKHEKKNCNKLFHS